MEEQTKANIFLSFIKNSFLFVLLVSVIASSFWVSFMLGKRILLPAQETSENQIAVTIPEPPESIAALQEYDKTVKEEKLDTPKQLVVPKREPQTVIINKNKKSPKRETYYKVQAGLFVDKNKAIARSKKLQESGFVTFLNKASTGWRVQAGAFTKRAQALSMQASLLSKGYKSMLVYE